MEQVFGRIGNVPSHGEAYLSRLSFFLWRLAYGQLSYVLAVTLYSLDSKRDVTYIGNLIFDVCRGIILQAEEATPQSHLPPLQERS